MSPIVTEVGSARLEPEMVTVSPPAASPALGTRPATIGAAPPHSIKILARPYIERKLIPPRRGISIYQRLLSVADMTLGMDGAAA
jgi:hypothetical protein